MKKERLNLENATANYEWCGACAGCGAIGQVAIFLAICSETENRELKKSCLVSLEK